MNDYTKIIADLEYAAYNLCDSKKYTDLPKGIIESTSPEDSLLIAIRDLKQLVNPVELRVIGENGGQTLSSQKDVELKQNDIIRIPRTGEIKVVAFVDDFSRVWFKENCIGISYVEKLTDKEISRLLV